LKDETSDVLFISIPHLANASNRVSSISINISTSYFNFHFIYSLTLLSQIGIGFIRTKRNRRGIRSSNTEETGGNQLGWIM